MILSKRSANFNMVFVYQLTYQHRSPIFYLLAQVQPPLMSKHGFTIRKFVMGSHAPEGVFHFSAIVTTWKQLIVVSKSSCPFFSFCLPQYIQVGTKTSISTLVFKLVYCFSFFTLSHNLSQSGLRTISVLLFFALPSSVELSATGLNFPLPAAVRRAGSML